jgi:hypothetical protein
MTDRELFEQALDALEHLQTDVEWQYKSPTRAMLRKIEKALRARLAQPEPWVKTYSGGKPNYTQPIEQEPFEYWNAVEGWVKIDEVRQHFDTAGCGTIYKTAGEDRVPLYASPPKKEWVGFLDEEPVAWGVDEGEGRCISLHDLYFVKEDADHMAKLKGTHAKVVALYTAPPKKEWVGLTDKEIEDCLEMSIQGTCRAIEAKLKDNNYDND